MGVGEEECVMRDLQGVADTLFIPLVTRIYVSVNQDRKSVV